MADDIHNLVLSPFRDIVTKGNQALENATQGDSEPMTKAAQSLVNNAERALKKIEPVCQRQFNEYHSVFVDALKENDDITHFREQLNDMIWDLDDCIEVDSFDAEIYTKLQTLLRTAALKISDIVVRMKLEHSRLPEIPITPISGRPRTPSIIVSPSPGGSPMEAKAGPVQGWEEGEEVTAGNETEQPVQESPTIKTPAIRLKPVPPEPGEDPWRGPATESLTLQIHSLSTENAAIQRRPRISPGSQHDGEPVSPLTPENEAVTPPFKHSPSSSRDDIVSPLDEDPRNSFILPSSSMASVTASWGPQPSPQMGSDGPEQPGELASPSSVYSEYHGDPGDASQSGKVVVVPDTEGLIPVEGEYHTSMHAQFHHPDQNPTVIVIEPFPRSPSGADKPLPPLRIETKSKYTEDSTPPLLDLTPGSRITNVSFPAQYNGEWAIGWDSINQIKGLFRMDCVKVEMPSGGDAEFFRGMGGENQKTGGIGIGLGKRRGRSTSTGGLFSGGGGNGNGNHGGLSGLSAVARWGFGGPGTSSGSSAASGTATLKKEKERSGFSFGGGGANSEGLQWLKFEKGEVVTGVCFPHSQHWCWAGYNSKNKWGIFPRAFMTPGTLLEEAPSNLLQLLHKEGNHRPHSSSKQTSPTSGSGWASLASSSSPSPPSSSGAGGAGVGIGTTLFSRISAKGLPLPLGLRRLSSGPGNGTGNSPISGSSGRRDTGIGAFFNTDDDWARRPSDGEPTPDSPSGSFYTHTPASAGSNSTTTRSPRPSLY